MNKKRINLRNICNKLIDKNMNINFDKINFNLFYFNFDFENDFLNAKKYVRINIQNLNYEQLFKRLSAIKKEFKLNLKNKNNDNNYFDFWDQF